MEPPYAKLDIYWGSVTSAGLSEGKLYGDLPKSELFRRPEIQRRIRANQIIDRRMADGGVSIKSRGLVESLSEVDELSGFITEQIPDSELIRSLFGCAHGRLDFHGEMLIRGYSMKTRAKLVELLLEAPYQPEIARKVYISAQIWEKEVDEPKEWKKLWRSRIKFIK